MAGLKLPVFGRPLTASEFENPFTGISYEMLRCSRKGSTRDTINILHASPDVNLVDAEITQVVDFMKTVGFTVERERGPGGWVLADVLVFGVDEKLLPNTNCIFDTIVRGAGLIQGWDVLIYGIGVEPPGGIGEPELPLRAGQSFGLDGICMLHTHLRLRGNTHFWMGFFAYMAIELETYIDRIVGRTDDSLHDKICRLERELVDADMCGLDAKMFLSAANIVREVRNLHAHSQRGMSPGEILNRDTELHKSVQGFTRMAGHYRRLDLLAGSAGYLEGGSGWRRYLARTALAARRWIYDCQMLVPPS